jgi:hypothetical protein
VFLRVTATAFEVEGSRRVLLALEDVADLIQLQSLLPICAWCKKVRTGEKYWEEVDRFLTSRLSVEFTHCICEKCLAEKYPEEPEDRGETGSPKAGGEPEGS